MTLPDPDFNSDFYKDVPAKRLVAWGIDVVIITALCILVIPFTAFTALFFLPVLYFTLGLTYRTMTLAKSSATLGMRIMAIELRDKDGARFDLKHAAIHSLLHNVLMASFIGQFISILSLLMSTPSRSLPDHLLGSVMINKRAKYA